MPALLRACTAGTDHDALAAPASDHYDQQAENHGRSRL
jgi:hypothetical protein